MIKKLIIVEGTDNSGKDTLINGLCKHYKDEILDIHHFDRPRSKTNEDCAQEQNAKFLAFVNDLVNANDDRIVILNRAWYGEYIYGTMYRGRTKEDVLNMIWECEKILNDNKIDSTYIQLIGDPHFLSNHDDGQSLSEGKEDLINTEGELFKEIFTKSKLINKTLIEVNKFGIFIPKKAVLETAIHTIENRNNEIFIRV